MKVYLVERENIAELPGGDQTTIDKIVQYLRGEVTGEGLEILHGPIKTMPDDTALAHLFNFALPVPLNNQAKICTEKGIPYVITCIAEDRASYWREMHSTTKILMDWANYGFYEVPEFVNSDDGFLDTRAAVEGARALFCNGELEARHVRALYPRAAKRVEIVRLGMDTFGLVGQASPPKFQERDYIFCAGRLEDRKNQLALLFALKDIGAPIVFATGGNTPQPKYADACRKVQRKGRTIFLDRLLPEQFTYVMAHCRVYAQPSWCELPGLAICEAATFGKKIVATCEGGSTTPEYIKENVFWCKPYYAESIRAACELAWHGETATVDPFSHINPRMPSHFSTWEGYAHTMASHYVEAIKQGVGG